MLAVWEYKVEDISWKLEQNLNEVEKRGEQVKLEKPFKKFNTCLIGVSKREQRKEWIGIIKEVIWEHFSELWDMSFHIERAHQVIRGEKRPTSRYIPVKCQNTGGKGQSPVRPHTDSLTAKLLARRQWCSTFGFWEKMISNVEFSTEPGSSSQMWRENKRHGLPYSLSRGLLERLSATLSSCVALDVLEPTSHLQHEANSAFLKGCCED